MTDTLHIRRPRVETLEVEISKPELRDGCWYFDVRCDAKMLMADTLGESVSLGVREWQKRMRKGGSK